MSDEHKYQHLCDECIQELGENLANRDLSVPGMRWKAFEPDANILISKATHYTEIEGGKWIRCTGPELTMEISRVRMIETKCWAAVKNKDGKIYDRILEELEEPPWRELDNA